MKKHPKAAMVAVRRFEMELTPEEFNQLRGYLQKRGLCVKLGLDASNLGDSWAARVLMAANAVPTTYRSRA
jgi:hypothetical protein